MGQAVISGWRKSNGQEAGCRGREKVLEGQRAALCKGPEKRPWEDVGGRGVYRSCSVLKESSERLGE